MSDFPPPSKVLCVLEQGEAVAPNSDMKLGGNGTNDSENFWSINYINRYGFSRSVGSSHKGRTEDSEIQWRHIWKSKLFWAAWSVLL